jgi:hypothetical protein
MSNQDAVADLPVLPMRVGNVVGCSVLGLLALIAIVVTSNQPVGALIGALFFATFFGVLTWVMSRGFQRTQLADLSHVASPDSQDSQRAILRGLFWAIVLAVMEALVLGCLMWLWGRNVIESIAGGILLGFAVWQVLDARDLRRWQDCSGLVLFTRAGANRMAFTRKQARGQFVVVAKDG